MTRGTTPHPAAQVPQGGGSLLRVLVGVVLLVVAVAVAVFGFLSLIKLLDAGGYGTPAMTRALTLLGVSGACFAGGTATLIWDVAKRYGCS